MKGKVKYLMVEDVGCPFVRECLHEVWIVIKNEFPTALHSNTHRLNFCCSYLSHHPKDLMHETESDDEEADEPLKPFPGFRDQLIHSGCCHCDSFPDWNRGGGGTGESSSPRPSKTYSVADFLPRKPIVYLAIAGSLLYHFVAVSLHSLEN